MTRRNEYILVIGLEGTFARSPPFLFIGTTMVSCRFSLKLKANEIALDSRANMTNMTRETPEVCPSTDKFLTV